MTGNVNPQLNAGPVEGISLASLSFPKVGICENTDLTGEEMKLPCMKI
jgi:hypothetical protein